MKIEKLTENKIRVVMNTDDLEENHTDLHTLMTKAMDSQGIFLNILEKAEKEVDFYTDGYKLLIEAFSSGEEALVFTITKYAPKESSTFQDPKKKLLVKRKSVNLSTKQAIYQFDDFDTFCHFCNSIHHMSQLDSKKFSKQISLHFYYNTYYLVIKNINTQYQLLQSFYSVLSEFATLVSYSNQFENKLIEHGDVIMKKDAILTGIKYFVS